MDRRTSDTISKQISDGDAMVMLGTQLSRALPQVPECVIYLEGSLGAGKTTLVRGILSGLGHQGSVKSPTYTLVETYAFPELQVYHWDMYRLSDPLELEHIGIRDYQHKSAWWLIEWPEKVLNMLPAPDLIIRIEVRGDAREVSGEALTEKGKKLTQQFF